MSKYEKMTAEERKAIIMADMKANATGIELEALEFLDKVNEAERAFNNAEQEKLQLSKAGLLTHSRRIELDGYFSKWINLKDQYKAKYMRIVEGMIKGVKLASDEELEGTALAGATVAQASKAQASKALSPEDEEFVNAIVNQW